MTALFGHAPDYPNMAFVDMRPRRTAWQRRGVKVLALFCALAVVMNLAVAWAMGDVVALLSGILMVVLGFSAWRALANDALWLWATTHGPPTEMEARVAQILRPVVNDATTHHDHALISVYWSVRRDGVRIHDMRLMGDRSWPLAHIDRTPIPYTKHAWLWWWVGPLYGLLRIPIVSKSMLTTGSAHQRLALCGQSARFLPPARHRTPEGPTRHAHHV